MGVSLFLPKGALWWTFRGFVYVQSKREFQPLIATSETTVTLSPTNMAPDSDREETELPGTLSQVPCSRGG